MKSLMIKTGNIELYTETFGNKANQAMLLISGAMAPAKEWPDEFCTQLAYADYFVIRYYHRDMGLSSAIDYAKNPYTINDLAKDAISILDAYGIKKAHIVGHSMGGGIAQLLALDYQDRIASITVISSSVLATPELNAQEKTSLEHTWQIMMKNKPTTKLSESVDGFLKSYEYLHGTIPMDTEMARTYIKDMYERTRHEHLVWFDKFTAGLEPLHNHVKAQQNVPDRTKDLQKLAIPVLVIHGQQDCLSFTRIVEDYCVKHIQQAKMYIIPGMGHMILSRELFENIKNLIIENNKNIH